MKLRKQKNTKIDLAEDYKSRIWRFEIQPKSTILAESRELLTRVWLLRPIILVPQMPVRVVAHES
jgi:hypothetical protein